MVGPASLTLSQVEVHEHQWIRPADAMARRNAGEITLAPPTFTSLWQLSRFPDTAAALAAASASDPPSFLTRLVSDDAGQPVATVWAGDAAYDDGDLERPGPRRRLMLVEPEWRVEMS